KGKTGKETEKKEEGEEKRKEKQENKEEKRRATGFGPSGGGPLIFEHRALMRKERALPEFTRGERVCQHSSPLKLLK
ncbi:hypothetical protein PIB30_075922, partial [Stylosanthes scabra]|nr:hypothetical protein [Stylosanthes scabra]